MSICLISNKRCQYYQTHLCPYRYHPVSSEVHTLLLRATTSFYCGARKHFIQQRLHPLMTRTHFHL
jgi:hypothetical protein